MVVIGGSLGGIGGVSGASDSLSPQMSNLKMHNDVGEAEKERWAKIREEHEQ